MSDSDTGFMNIVGFSLDMVDGLRASGRAGETFRIPAEVFWDVFMRMDAPKDAEELPDVLADLGASIAEDMAYTFDSPSLMILKEKEGTVDACPSEERFLKGIGRTIMIRLCEMGWIMMNASIGEKEEAAIGEQ